MSLNGQLNEHPDNVPTVKETIHKYLIDLKSQLDRLPEDAEVVKGIIDGLFTENVVDDRECEIATSFMMT